MVSIFDRNQLNDILIGKAHGILERNLLVLCSMNNDYIVRIIKVFVIADITLF